MCGEFVNSFVLAKMKILTQGRWLWTRIVGSTPSYLTINNDVVEYGSSFGALWAAGLTQGIRDTVVNLNEKHLLRSAETVYEAVEDAGLTAAAINITTYRGRQLQKANVPGFPPVHAPKRFFFYSVYESDKTGAPMA